MKATPEMLKAADDAYMAVPEGVDAIHAAVEAAVAAIRMPDVTNWQELCKIGCETAQGFGLSDDLEKLLGLDIAHELEDVANAAWEQGRSAALAALVEKTDEMREAAEEAVLLLHANGGLSTPLRSSDIESIVDVVFSSTDKATAWDQCIKSGQRARDKALEEATHILETYPLAKVPPQNMSWFGEIIDTIRSLKSEEPK